MAKIKMEERIEKIIIELFPNRVGRLSDGTLEIATSSTNYIAFLMENENELKIEHRNGEMNFIIWSTTDCDEFNIYLKNYKEEDEEVSDTIKYLNEEEGIYCNILINSNNIKEEIKKVVDYAKKTSY